jgi:hypothetical protein
MFQENNLTSSSGGFKLVGKKSDISEIPGNFMSIKRYIPTFFNYLLPRSF